MNELQVFNNDLFGEIRFVEVEGKPYAVANDVAKALGYKNPTDAVNTKCMNIVKHEVENSRGQMRMTNVIPEGRNKIYKHGRGICFYIKGWNEFKNCLKSRNKNQ